MIEKKHYLYLVIVCLIITFTSLSIYQKNNYEERVLEYKLQGLIEGFDQGFASGTEFGIGETVGLLKPENKWENGTFYYQEGYNRLTIYGYNATQNLNPYKGEIK